MIKTTRIKSSQAPRMVTYDLTDQIDGVKQTFNLPRTIGNQDSHYVIFNTTVYRNDENHQFYSVSADGNKLTTYFSSAPLPGVNRLLQFVVSEDYTGDDYVTREEMMAAIAEAIGNQEGEE